MKFTRHVIDRHTGEVVEIDKGDWVTITELADLVGVGPRRVRAILREMDFLYVEGGRAHSRHRLTPWVVKKGFGTHIPARPPKRRYPFDVISPEGRDWIESRWSDAIATLDARSSRPLAALARKALTAFQAGRLAPLDVQGSILWLHDHFRDLTHTEIAGILDVTQQLVSRRINIRSRQKAGIERAITAPLPDLGRVRVSFTTDEDTWPSGGTRYITEAHNKLENAALRSEPVRFAA